VGVITGHQGIGLPPAVPVSAPARAYAQVAADVGAARMPFFGHPSVEVQNAALLRRAVEIHPRGGLGFGDACVLAAAEETGTAGIATFDREFFRRSPQARLPGACGPAAGE